MRPRIGADDDGTHPREHSGPPGARLPLGDPCGPWAAANPVYPSGIRREHTWLFWVHKRTVASLALPSALARAKRRPSLARQKSMNLIARLAVVPLVAAVTVAGVWVAGGQLTDNFRAAMLFTALWFGAAGLAALLVGYRWRALRVPVVGTFLVVAAAIGLYLAISMFRTTVVNEPLAPGTSVAAGGFVSEAHETTGRAQVVRLANDRLAVNLVAFETDPGPDLRVYLVPGNGSDVAGALDLGGLEGNKGTQRYEVPAGTDVGRFGAVVIWCRAFSVSFGRAELQA